MKKRDLLFDNIRGILIFLVVLGHSLEYFRLDNIVGEYIYVFIYQFHMPVFVFISGFFSKNLKKGRDTALTTFAIPFIGFNTVLNLISFLLGQTDKFEIFNPGWTMWYLFSMFIWRLLLPDLVRVKKIFVISLIVGLFYGFFNEFGAYMSLARTIGYFPYFIAGFLTEKEMLEKLCISKYKVMKCIAITIVAILNALIWVIYNLKPEFLWKDRAYDFFSMETLHNLWFEIWLYVIGFGFVFLFITLTTSKKYFFTNYGQKTLTIYLLHIYLVAPLIQFSQYIENPVLHFALLVGASLTITHILSQPAIDSMMCKLLGRSK